MEEIVIRNLEPGELEAMVAADKIDREIFKLSERLALLGLPWCLW